MIRGVRTMVEVCEVSLVDAVRMASLNPARALKIDGRKGSIFAGADADLVVLTPDLAVRETWVGGQAVYGR